jgi:cbb3-type cytochrome oxidase subunit 3
MERKDMIWTAVLSSLAALVALVGSLYACYWWQRRKRKREEEEEEAETVVIMQHPTSTLSRLNGILSLKTPLISTKALG